LVALLLILAPGCGARHAPVRKPVATQPVVRMFDRPDLGVRFTWPAGWQSRPSSDFVLLLTPSNARGDETWISLDVPKLPPHIPGLIPIGSVRNGYLDDLRKSMGKLETKDLTPPGVASAAQRLVRSTWSDASGTSQQETALLLVHDDGVYILRCRSCVADEQATRAAFDEIVRSLAWTGKQSGPASKPARAS
jgi:hypothetical protein